MTSVDMKNQIKSANFLLYEKIKKMTEHDLFSCKETMDKLHIFMQWHVFAVWDFMSLVKRLQNDFTCTAIPWNPPKNKEAARLINEIVLGEESDDLLDETHGSHLDLYISAMDEVHADTTQIRKFISLINDRMNYIEALEQVCVPDPVKHFVITTIHLCLTGHTHEVLASFFYGRENIIPRMFKNLLKLWKIDENKVPTLKYYLCRHIAVDGDSHGPATKKILASVAQSDDSKTFQMYVSAITAVNQRISLWDALLKEIKNDNR